jgi:hypothetical protein
MDDYIYNPKTHRYVLKTGRVGKMVLKEQEEQKKRKSPPRKTVRFSDLSKFTITLDIPYIKDIYILREYIKARFPSYKVDYFSHFKNNMYTIDVEILPNHRPLKSVESVIDRLKDNVPPKIKPLLGNIYVK